LNALPGIQEVQGSFPGSSLQFSPPTIMETSHGRLYNNMIHHIDFKIYISNIVWSIALYGSETFTLRKLERKYLESFELWCWRRMENIKWSEKVTNEQVIERIGEKKKLLNYILRRKVN